MKTMDHTSRRKFVVGGLVSVAGLGLAGCSGGGSGQSSSGSVVVPADTAVPLALTKTEVDEWDKLVGASFVITSEVGKTIATLSTLERLPADSNRPAGLRRQPFYAYFEMDEHLTPKGGTTYQVSHASKGVFDLFMGMKGTARGKGVLVASLN